MESASIGRLLAGIEAKILSVRRVEEALEPLDETEFALILIDVRSLGDCAIKAARMIRGRNRSKDTPILFLAERDNTPDFSVRDAHALGAVDCMIGPVDPEILRSKVRMFLDLFWRTRAAVHSAWDARERLEDVLSTVNDMFLILDRDLRYLYVNDRMVRSSGIPRDRLLGRTLSEVFPDMAGSRLEHELRRSIAEQVPVRFEFYDTSSDRWYDNRTYPSGKGLVLVTTEITDAKRAEQATRRQVGMLDAVLSTSVDHIYLFDREGRYVLTSEGAARFLGLSREEIVGRSWRELGLPADVMDSVDRQRERVLASGRSEL
ncbi:PAS domain-containing protein, partial [Singulisphaera rosea]